MYTELDIISNFSFLVGASHPEEYFQQARILNYTSLGIADHNTFAGIVKAYQAAREQQVKLLPGCRFFLNISANPHLELELITYPLQHQAYTQLCQLISLGKSKINGNVCSLNLDEALSYLGECQLIIKVPNSSSQNLNKLLLNAISKLKDSFDDRLLSLALYHPYFSIHKNYQKAVCELSEYFKIALVATNAVKYHSPNRKILTDVLSCIKNHCDFESAGFLIDQNSERHLKPLAEIQRLFKDYPSAIKRTQYIAESIQFCVSQIKYEYPDYDNSNDASALQTLQRLCFEGANARYPQGLPQKVLELIQAELKLIEELKYEKYFLTCYRIVKFARSKDILCQGRGSAANSVVCYCLGITAVDPEQIDLLFARFVSKERLEPPDIDIDFEHERRDEVIQFIYETYGREHAALVANVVTYRAKSALRETAKVFGLSTREVQALSKLYHHWTGLIADPEDLKTAGLEHLEDKINQILLVSQQLMGFPRHLSQHVGGFIISKNPLSTIVPVFNATMENRYVVEWNKDDIEYLEIFKIDILALGMLTCIRKALELINQSRAVKSELPISYHQIPKEDPEVYDMLCAADTVGVFQVESRAQMSMLPRLKPRCFYDLVIEVALVRPGPIQGNMVHPYLKRRNREEVFHFPDQRVKSILGKTYGVPIFQEQAMRLAITLAGFSPGEAEQLRRAMAAWKHSPDKIVKFKDRIIKGMQDHGYDLDFAETCLKQIQGFSEYGFPESHAASFAILVYVSAWIKKFYPAEFAAALLNSQPMGFYQPAQIIDDARRHGVMALPLSISKSKYLASLEYRNERACIRLGFSMISGIKQSQAELLEELVTKNPSISKIENLWKSNSKIERSALIKLAASDVFADWGYNRRNALWAIKALNQSQNIMDYIWSEKQSSFSFVGHSQVQEIKNDYNTIGLSLKGHPLEHLRKKFQSHNILSTKEIRKQAQSIVGKSVNTVGLVLFRQRPGTSKGVVFLTLEDEFGFANIVIMPDVFEHYQKVIIRAKALLVQGTVEANQEVLYIKGKFVASLVCSALSP